MKKAGIYKPSDLIPFPWDNELDKERASEEDTQELYDMLLSMKKKEIE